MGEVGIPVSQFYHGLKWWEMQAIIRGYNRRSRGMWSATRWQAYRIMEAFVGSDAMKKSGLMNPTDLIHFPWEDEMAGIMSEEEQMEFQAELKSYKNLQF